MIETYLLENLVAFGDYGTLSEAAEKLREYKKEGKPCFVFAPTIVLCESLYEKVSLAVKNGSSAGTGQYGPGAPVPVPA